VGELIFESNDLEQWWNGVYEGNDAENGNFCLCNKIHNFLL
jgi:hypothetical protein